MLASLLAAVAFARLAAPAAPDGVPALWWLSRASGFLAYLALTSSMLLGVLVSARTRAPALGKRRMLQLHEHSLVVVVAATAVHVIAVAGHETLGGDARSIVASLPAIFGMTALLGLVLLAASRRLRAHLSQPAFRWVHLLAYLVFFAGVGHAATAGGGGVDARLRVAYLLGGAALALLAGRRAAPSTLRRLGLRPRAPLLRARWRRALRGKRHPVPLDPPDDSRRRPAA